MRTRKNRVAGSHTLISLTVDRGTLAALDDAARLMGVDRQEVLLRGFDLLTVSAHVILGHEDHLSPGNILASR